MCRVPPRLRLLLAAVLGASVIVACAEDRPIRLPAPTRPDRAIVDTDGGPADDARPSDDDGGPPAPDAQPGDDAAPPAPDARPGDDAAPNRPDAQPPLDSGLPDTGQAAPDLVVHFGSPVPTHVAPGANVTLVVEVGNVGTRLAPPTEVVVDLRAAGTAQATQLTLVGVRSLDVGRSETFTLSLVMPAALPPASYLLRAIVDPSNLTAESDEANNTVEVMVSGSGLDVAPSSLALGPTVVGCEAAVSTVRVNNVGGVSATIDSAAIVGNAELRVRPLSLPQTVPPGGSMMVSVGYAPIDVGTDVAQLRLGFTQGSMGTLLVPLTGEGRMAMLRNDTFQQAAASSRLDMLMVIDDSGSMSEEQSQLAGEMGSFLSWAQQNGVDFRVAVVTTDMDDPAASGRFQGSPTILTPTTPNLTQAFASNITRGTFGSGDERGIDAILAALTPPLSSGSNANFLRSDAVLGVLVLSDEEDSSTIAVTTAIAQLSAVKPGGVVRVNAIVSPAVACFNSGSAGARYTALAIAFSGTVASICDPSWTGALTTWGMINSVSSRFTLTRPARATGITVRVNGAVVSGGAGTWVYDSTSNAVVFAPGAAPPPGATIEIAYTEACGP